MCDSTEQRIYIKFCFKIGKTATETYQLLLQAYGEDAMGRTHVFDWFLRFKEDRTSVESNPARDDRQHRETRKVKAKVRIIIRNNRRLRVREIADDLRISVGSCDAILTEDLHMKRAWAKFVPRFPTRATSDNRPRFV